MIDLSVTYATARITTPLDVFEKPHSRFQLRRQQTRVGD
jgi:hypothetical protein